MSSLVAIGKVGGLADGAMTEVVAQGKEILLVRVGDVYYAADNRCPHMGGNLARGVLDGFIVTCPRHGSQFDMRTGEVVRWLRGSGLVWKIAGALKSPRNLKTYPVRLENGSIMIEI